MNTGIHTKTIEAECRRVPSPNRVAPTPISMGLRTQAYGPVVTSSRGGFAGTACPLNWIKHQIQSAAPPVKTTIPMPVPLAPASSGRKASALSVAMLPATTAAIIPKKMVSPTAASRRLRRSGPVVMAYSTSVRLILHHTRPDPSQTPVLAFESGKAHRSFIVSVSSHTSISLARVSPAQYGHGGGTKVLSNPSPAGNAEAVGGFPVSSQLSMAARPASSCWAVNAQWPTPLT